MKMMKTFGYILSVAAVSALTAYGTVQYMGERQEMETNPTYTWDTQMGATNVAYTPAVSRASVTDNDFTQAAEKTVGAVVGIANKQNRRQQSMSGYNDPFFDFFFGSPQRQQPQQPQGPATVGSGSGVIISADGYIVTNNHVVDGADELTVTLNDQREFVATLIGTDPTTDIALLKVEAKDLPTIPFGESDALKVGEWVLAVGNPFNLTSTVTAGIVSAKGRALGGHGGQMGIESFIQTDAAVNPGNSGGALINTAGELIGINTAIYSQTGNYAGYSFAVPSSIVSKVVTDLRQYGTVQRALLGITGGNVTAELADRENLKVNEGVWVNEVQNESAANEAGIQKGDVIVKLGSTPIRTMSQLQEQIARFRPGDKTTVTINREGKEKTVSVTFRNVRGNTDVVKINGIDRLGCTFKNPSTEELHRYGVRSGVIVSKIESNGLVARSQMKERFLIYRVNDQVVKSDKDIEKIVEQLTTDRSGDQDPVLFIKGVYPNGQVAYYAIDLSK